MVVITLVLLVLLIASYFIAQEFSNINKKRLSFVSEVLPHTIKF